VYLKRGEKFFPAGGKRTRKKTGGVEKVKSNRMRKGGGTRPRQIEGGGESRGGPNSSAARGNTSGPDGTNKREYGREESETQKEKKGDTS